MKRNFVGNQDVLYDLFSTIGLEPAPRSSAASILCGLLKRDGFELLTEFELSLDEEILFLHMASKIDSADPNTKYRFDLNDLKEIYQMTDPDNTITDVIKTIVENQAHIMLPDGILSVIRFICKAYFYEDHNYVDIQFDEMVYPYLKQLIMITNALNMYDVKMMNAILSKLDIDLAQDDIEDKVFIPHEEHCAMFNGRFYLDAIDIELRLDHLLRHRTMIKKDHESFRIYPWFSSVSHTKNQSGKYDINIGLNIPARKDFFDLKSAVTTDYGYSMFFYLLFNRYLGTWKTSIQDLTQILGCEKEYSEFSDFDDKVLKPLYHKITEAGMFKYRYTPICSNSEITEIEFSVLGFNRDIDEPKYPIRNIG